MQKYSHAEFVKDVIDSCTTLEHLIVTQAWIRNIWEDKELIMFADKRIEQRERDIGTANASSTVDIGKQRFH